MSKGASPPPAPDPYAVGQAQTGTNVSTAIANSELNNVNRVNPFGSTTYAQTGGYTDPSTGQWVPQWTQTQSLNPTLQDILTGTQNTAASLVPAGQALANSFMSGMWGGDAGQPQGGPQGGGQSLWNGDAGQPQGGGQSAPGIQQNSVITRQGSGPGPQGPQTQQVTGPNVTNSRFGQLNPNGANNDIIQGGPQALYGPAATAAYNAADTFLEPQFSQQNKDLQDQLARQGISVGNQAYGNATGQLMNNQNQMRSSLANSAINQGINAGNNMFGLAIQGQNQQLGQQQLLQQNPLRLLSMLYGGMGGTGGLA